MKFQPADPVITQYIRDHLDAIKARGQAEQAAHYAHVMGLLHGPPATAGERLEAARHLGRDIGE